MIDLRDSIVDEVLKVRDRRGISPIPEYAEVAFPDAIKY